MISEQDVTEELIARKALETAAKVEKQIDNELHALRNLDGDSLEILRQKRLAEMKQRANQEVTWRQQGHGTYTEIADQKEWFDITKNHELVVCHFYRPTTWRCEIVDKHLTALAKKYIATRFIKINAENCPFLVERLQIVLMPTIICTKNNFTHDRIEGFDELGGVDNFSTAVMERRLAKNTMIEYQMMKDREEAKRREEDGEDRPRVNGIRKGVGKKAIYGRSNYDSDEDSD